MIYCLRLIFFGWVLFDVYLIENRTSFFSPYFFKDFP